VGKSYANFSSSISIHTNLLRFAGLPTSGEIWYNSKDQIWLSNYSNNAAILDESSSSILWVRVVIIIWGRGSYRGKRKIRSLWISAWQVDCCHGTPEFPHKDSFSYQKSTSDFKSGDDAALEKWRPDATPKLSEMEHKKGPTQWLLSHTSLNLLPTTTVCIRVTRCRTSRVHTQQRRETHTRDAWISCHALITQYSSQS
jgi:hypothetical protein